MQGLSVYKYAFPVKRNKEINRFKKIPKEPIRETTQLSKALNDPLNWKVKWLIICLLIQLEDVL